MSAVHYRDQTAHWVRCPWWGLHHTIV